MDSVATEMSGPVTAAIDEVGARASGVAGAALGAAAAGTLVTCTRTDCLSRVRRFGTVDEPSCSNNVKEYTLRMSA